MMTKVRGRFDRLPGPDPGGPCEAQKVLLGWKPTIQTTSIDTANATRDQDLRGADFFDVEKHPTIIFKSTRITPRAGLPTHVNGDSTMRGVSKEITLPVAFLGFMKNQRGIETRPASRPR